MRDVAATDPLIGVMVGSYKIERQIGAGGMGRVYAAVQPEVGSKVAIKVLNEEYAREPEVAERFFAEARAVNLIAHENIVSVLDLVHLPDGRPVIIMELLEGHTLRDLVRAGQPPIGAVVHVMIEVLSALAAAHGAGIVHRDLKPDNIIVLPSGRAKVLDFGIAKLVGAEPGTAPRTRTGALVGTPEYMAPEQIGGRSVDARTDIYSAGVVLYELLVRRRPFEGASDFEIMRKHVDDPAPSARESRPEIPALVEAVIMRALAKAPADRFPTAVDMANALHAASASLPESAWQSLTPHGRAYTRPAPLTPIAPRFVAEGTIRDDMEFPSSVETAAGPPKAHEHKDIGLGPTIVDPTPRSKSKRVLIGVCAVTLIGAGTVGLVLRNRDTTKPTPKPASDEVKTSETAPTYDPEHFDPVAFTPKALELARTFMPDAALMFIKVVPVHADGTVDLTKAFPKQNIYLYRPEKAAAGEHGCVAVEPYPTKVLSYIYTAKEWCDFPMVTHRPRCQLADVWKRAMAQRAFTSEEAHVGYLGEDGGSAYWYVDPSMATRMGAGLRIEDDCP